jgi:hypothetical protein
MKTMRPLIALLLSSTSLIACQQAQPPPELESAVAELSSTPACTATKLEAFSSDADEGRLVFSVDGKSAYFHRATGSVLALYESRKIGGVWTAPALLPFGVPGVVEFDPFLTIDGKTLYYTSYRGIDGGAPRPDGDIWKVTRTASGWGTPVHLGPEVNTDANEFFPSVTADGALYFNSDRDDGVGAWDIYRAARQGGGFDPAEPIPGEVNTEIWEFNPSLTPGGHFLAFGSLDPDPAAPYSDVFFSIRVFGDEFSERVNAGPCINTEGEEYHPTVDWARNRLIFVRFDPETGGDFYEVALTDALAALF